ncbi:DUF3626 domain-containing protein [Nocardia carnea]|uniref:DUF3626 domain-containing protein n=1 Tax=Nocardia carnea TaxID=37328 RepID=UPI002453F7D7|nr:DUF3626 domain-containing protein [Nocardia carnea]
MIEDRPQSHTARHCAPRPAARLPGVTIQFHPDWPFRNGTVLEAIAADGRYRSQFETGTSNGGLTAHHGGDRWQWESRLFNRKYDVLPPESRPVYGAWNRHADAYGGSPRFGSAYFRLRPLVHARATFCFPDSTYHPTEVVGSSELGRLARQADDAGHDYLDDYIEAHIHSGVVLTDDVEALVLDPCHQHGPIADAAAQLDIPVEFHPGYRIDPRRLDARYRGQAALMLALSLGHELTPDKLSAAARSGEHDPQIIKRTWHLLARFGRNRSSG